MKERTPVQGFVPRFNSTVAAKLREAGAVLLGKLNMDEFAMGSSCENSGLGTTRNPWDLGRVPGGSSGGSATAVAARQVLGETGDEDRAVSRMPREGRLANGLNGPLDVGVPADQLDPVYLAVGLDEGTRKVTAALVTQLADRPNGKDRHRPEALSLEVVHDCVGHFRSDVGFDFLHLDFRLSPPPD